jgi:1,4-dihydroxy-6-naphthoate synthase
MNSEAIRIGLSPCPNDTFICDALLHGKIDTEGLIFEPFFADVEKLNQMALKETLDITKVSFHAFLYLAKNYILLDSGCALGQNCGPLLISKKTFSFDEIPDLRIAIPGKYTTANLLLTLAFPKGIKKTEIIFSEIENAVLNGTFDAGLIIHENRFTYKEKGLVGLIDLGSFWEGFTGLPIPLGGFVIKRELKPALQAKLNRIMKSSVDYAVSYPASSRDFVKKHAQELRNDVIDEHIRLYVNEFTQFLNEEGRKAIIVLFSEAQAAGIPVYTGGNIFIDNEFYV